MRLRALVLAALLTAPAASAAVWPTEVDRVAHELESADPVDRRAAAARLAALPPHLAAPLVLRALSDQDLDVRLAAAVVAISHRVRGAGDVVVAWLNEPDARVRLAACQVLRPHPTEKSIPALARVLGDADARVRQAAANALGNAGSTDAVVALLGHLDDPAPEVRVAVVDALWRLGDPRAVVPIGGKIGDSVPEVRRSVARALGELGDRRATSALLLALRDQVIDVRVDALNALGSLGDPTSVLAIAPLADPQSPPEVRRAALGALGRIGGPKALAILVAALDRDEPAPGRAPARDAIVRMGDAAVPALLAALEAPSSERVAAFAAEALGAIGAKSARAPIVAALRKGVLPPIHALRALAQLGDPEALPVVLELLGDRSAKVRAEARRTTEALLLPGNVFGPAVDPIAAALADPRAAIDERASLARLLGRTHAPRAASILAPLAGGKSGPVRLAAIDALGLLGPAGDDPSLLVAIDDESPVVRAHAAVALAATASDRTLGALLDRIGSAAPQDRTAMATAIAGALGRATTPALVSRAASLLATSSAPMRDAIYEGLGRSATDVARGELVRDSASADVGDRRKIAEALAGHPAAKATLRSLLSDPDASVRANATWSFASAGDGSDLPALAPLLGDASAAVAADAAVAIGRIAAKTGAPDAAKGALCPALADGRSYVRAGALVALRLAGTRCDDGSPERAILGEDGSPVARRAAAELLSSVPSPAAEKDARALSRCRMEDPYGAVALRCAGGKPIVPKDTDPVTVLVVPEGAAQPDADAPFALVLADGSIRHGLADRRGAVFERAAPRGTIRLDVAAPFVR